MKSDLPVRVFLILFCTVLACPSANAVDPERRISQYAHTAWRVRDGVFPGVPDAIAQTTDGYIWIGSEGGLLRFDGVRFVRWTPPNGGEQLRTTPIMSLLGGSDGSLWIGTASGLVRWKNGTLSNFPETAGRVNAIYEDRQGTIWMVRSRMRAGALCKVTASVAKCYGPNDGIPPYAGTMTGDNAGNIWIGTSTALLRWKAGSATSYAVRGLKANATLAGITALAAAPDGSIWAGMSKSGPGLGLQQWANGTWRSLITPTLDSSTLNFYSALWLDRHNALWVGTDGDGIYRIHDGKVDHFRSADGLSGDTTESFFEDREGNLWVTTSDGIDCFRDIPVVNFSAHEGLSSDSDDSVLAARDGTIWIGNHAGLDHLRGDVVSSIGPNNGLPGKQVTSLFEDHAGRLWVGLDNGLFVYERGKFRPIRRRDGNPIGVILEMTEDVDSRIWAIVVRVGPGNPGGLIQIQDDGSATEIADENLGFPISLAADSEGGLWLALRKDGLGLYRNGQLQNFPLKNTNAVVLQVLGEPDGSVLAATNGGLVEQRGGTQYVLDQHNGLPCRRIYTIIRDKDSNLWLYSECGLISIKSAELQQWRGNPNQKIAFDLFDTYDGVQAYPGTFSPHATRATDGRLWFANGTVVQLIDPDRLYRNTIPPPVHIEDVIADGKSYSTRNGLHLPALTRDLEIDYTALSFVVPQNVQFRYKLEPYDREWQDPQTRRQAFYNNLPPGNYRFRMIASNNSGVWNEAGAELDLNIASAWNQTIWFRALCVLAFVALLWAVYRMRVHQLQEQEKKFRDAIETMPALAFVVDPNGNRTFFNRGWLEYTGLSSEKASSGWDKAIHPDDLDRINERWLESRTTGQPLDYEGRLRRGSDGVYRWFQTRARPLRDRRGRIVKWCAVATDIEDRRHAERLQADLTHASRLSTMGELVASISHELAQPITATTNNAKASLRWLQRDPPDLTQVRNGAERIIEASNFASQIIDRLRSLYKKASPKRERVAVNEIVSEMAGLLKSEARRHGVAIYTDLRDDLPLIVADRVQIQQVLMNLMLNGIEAMRDTGGVLTVKSQSGQASQIELSVNDTGQGLPPGKADQIFDAFFTTKPQGSGMGLAISKSIVESHGGLIWANGGGLGTTFHFTLPAAQEGGQ
jgi:PAS domain S-box-containing protein